jgi:hypothetical protein
MLNVGGQQAGKKWEKIWFIGEIAFRVQKNVFQLTRLFFKYGLES